MNNILEIEHLQVNYETYAGCVQAVRDISFQVKANSVTAIVGESGCGKSVTAKSILGLIEKPGEIHPESIIRFDGRNLVSQSEEEWQDYRGNQAAMIFQDALVALNPTMKVGEQVIESLENHRPEAKDTWKQQGIEMLRAVGIPDPERCMGMYPHELSGGMRQRVMIASALITHPKLVIADEPTTALDVTIQAQILKLMKDLQKKFQMSMILITHDLGIVADYADEILVMYAGKIVERGSAERIFNHPTHPYTKALIQAVPTFHLDRSKALEAIPGMVPDMIHPPEGCAFCNRCRNAMRICQNRPPMDIKVEADHQVSCWLPLAESQTFQVEQDQEQAVKRDEAGQRSRDEQ